jgi:hypothetical protein
MTKNKSSATKASYVSRERERECEGMKVIKRKTNNNKKRNDSVEKSRQKK